MASANGPKATLGTWMACSVSDLRGANNWRLKGAVYDKASEKNLS